jgi:hypothetical protein
MNNRSIFHSLIWPFAVCLLIANVGRAETESTEDFFKSKIAEIKSLNKDDPSANKAFETIELYNKKNYQSCADKAAKYINEFNSESVFFNFEFIYGVKCVDELFESKKLNEKTIKDWSQLYFKFDKLENTKYFHGAEMSLYVDYVLKLSEVLFLKSSDLNLTAEQMKQLAENLERSKNLNVKKELVSYFINKNDQASARNYLSHSDPELLDLATLELLNDHFKDDVYSNRIQQIKKSKGESQDLKRLYNSKKYSDFLDKIAQAQLVTDKEVDLASRQLGWLYVRGNQDFRDKTIANFSSLQINPNQFFWVLSNQGLFKDIISTFKMLDAKKKHLHLSMALKAYLYSGQYEEAFGFIKGGKILDEPDKIRPVILFYSSLILLRLNKDKQALELFEPLINKDTDYKLQAMYMKYNIFKDLNRKKESKNLAKELVSYYPLTFYGLVVAHQENLTAQLPFIESTELSKVSFKFDLQDESRKLKHLTFLFEKGLDHRFRKYIETTINSLSFESQILWAYKHKMENQPLSAIKLMNQVWTSRRDLIHPDIIPIAYPTNYLSEVKKHSVSGIDPFLVLGLIRQESAFQKDARSASSARGLMQLLTGTAREMARSLRMSRVSLPWGLYTPEINIKLGSFYLKRRIEAYKGHVPLALASYNVGPGRLQKWSLDRNTITEAQDNINNGSWKSQDLWVEEMPWDETRFYVKAVLRNYLLYKIFEDYKPFKECYRVWNCTSKAPNETTAKN